MAELADDPRVAELLLLLWDAPDREAGIAIVDLPTSLRNEDLLTACEGAQLIRFARRNHCWRGSGPHRMLIVESGWSVSELHKPDRKQAWQAVREAIDDDIPDEIRLHVQLCYRGSTEAGGLALARRSHGQLFTLLDRFPATPAGHVAFLEWVRDEVHYAAEAKRGQLERGYPNATIESMVRGIKWAEARGRLAELADLPECVWANIGDILHRELTAETVDQIDTLLSPAVSGVRDCLEKSGLSDLTGKIASVATSSSTSTPTKAKRSTERGEGRAKLIAALTKHHQYADGGCLNLAPIGNNELARLAGVDQATASAFFKQQFKGHGKYRAACADATRLAAALKLLNGEFAPH